MESFIFFDHPEDAPAAVFCLALFTLFAVVLLLISNIPSIYISKKKIVQYTYYCDVPTDKLSVVKTEFNNVQVITAGDTISSISISIDHCKSSTDITRDIFAGPLPAAVGIYITYILTHPALFSGYLPFLEGKTIPIEIACAIGSVIAIVLYGIWFKEILTVENQAKK